MNKSDVAYIALQNFHADYTKDFEDQTYTSQFNEVSTFVANVASHELGHILGFNHTNNRAVDDGNVLASALGTDWYNIMSAGPASVFEQYFVQWQFGTSSVWNGHLLASDTYTSGEFPIGQIDTLDLLLRWFGTPPSQNP